MIDNYTAMERDAARKFIHKHGIANCTEICRSALLKLRSAANYCEQQIEKAMLPDPEPVAVEPASEECE